MLTKIKKEEFEQVYRIMEASFPSDEHRPYEEQLELLDNTNYQIYVAKETDNSLEIKGFMAVWQFENLSFIEHFAVDSKYRNTGLGSRMLQEIKKHLTGRVCLEVELPDNDIAKRRIEFYQRNGLYYNDYPYIQPAISKGRNPIPLRIMTSESGIDKEEFCRIKNTLYKDVYKIQ
ncbi:MAG: GNAT family N-acetyltransferase [Lachnospiraceae bacterium]|nr:GNAT family N-acetyltransferase [Lachnospiraceae bacterium]